MIQLKEVKCCYNCKFWEVMEDNQYGYCQKIDNPKMDWRICSSRRIKTNCDQICQYWEREKE